MSLTLAGPVQRLMQNPNHVIAECEARHKDIDYIHIVFRIHVQKGLQNMT